MRNKILIFVFASLIISCGGEKKTNKEIKNKATIYGLMKEGKGELLYLQKISSTGYITLDSAIIENNNTFSFKPEVPFPGFYSLKNSGGNHIPIICYPNDSIKIKANYFSFKHYELSGSSEAVQTSILNNKTQIFLDKLDSISKITKDSIYNPNYSLIKEQLNKEYHESFQEFRAFSERFLVQNKESLVSLLALSNQLGHNFFVFHPKNDFEIFKRVDSSLFAIFPDNEPVNELHQQVLSLKNQFDAQESNDQSLRLQTKAPEINLPSPDGEMIKLSEYRGKYVLLDFWASWCPPCRRENPNLVKIYDQYTNKDFEIFQVSLDKSGELWRKAIADDHLNWINVSELKYWDSEVVKQYKISSIPANFLLDKDGIIIAKNLSGSELKEKLEDLLND